MFLNCFRPILYSELVTVHYFKPSVGSYEFGGMELGREALVEERN